MRNEIEVNVRGKISMIGVHVVFYGVDRTIAVGQCAPMPRCGSLRMEIGNEDVTTGRADAGKFSECNARIRDMAENEPAPNHVKAVRREGHAPDVTCYDVASTARSQHLRALINSDGARDGLNAAANPAARIQ
jgi:hypothetical protein